MAKFSLVGALGIVVQLAALWLLTRVGVSYLLATALAVESAVLHNFLWHQHFTWIDRQEQESGRRLLRFHLSNGAVSLIGNLLIMRVLVGILGIPSIPANLLSISLCALVNFLLSDQWVFMNSEQA